MNWPMGNSETAALIRSTDWSATSLGPVETWSASLKTAIGLCVDSKFAMYLWWGPDSINIYNDAYIPLAGKDKHPQYFGRPAQEMWPEIWPTFKEFLTSVWTTGASIIQEDFPLTIFRNGKNEETFFTFSYGPARDENGVIQGVHCTCIETTQKVRSQQKLTTSFNQLRNFFMQ